MWGDGGRSLSACWLSSPEHLPLGLQQMRRRGRGHAASPAFLPGSQKPAQLSDICQVLCFSLSLTLSLLTKQPHPKSKGMYEMLT